MNEIISIIVTFLLGLSALIPFWAKVKKVLKAVKEILDVPYSVGQVADLIDKGMEDKQLTTEEVQQISAAVTDVKTQLDEAKAAIDDLSFLGKKVVK